MGSSNHMNCSFDFNLSQEYDLKLSSNTTDFVLVIDNDVICQVTYNIPVVLNDEKPLYVGFGITGSPEYAHGVIKKFTFYDTPLPLGFTATTTTSSTIQSASTQPSSSSNEMSSNPRSGSNTGVTSVDTSLSFSSHEESSFDTSRRTTESKLITQSSQPTMTATIQRSSSPNEMSSNSRSGFNTGVTHPSFGSHESSQASDTSGKTTQSKGHSQDHSDSESTNDSIFLLFLVGIPASILVVLILLGMFGLAFFLGKRSSESNLKELSQVPIVTSALDKDPRIPILKGVVKEEKIGEGNFGQVFSGDWNGTKVALKSTTQSGSSHFEKEMALLSTVKHPNVVQFLGQHFDKENESFMVFEFMEQGSMLDLFKSSQMKGTAISLKQKLRALSETAKGMVYLSNMGIVHRDLAARNLLLDEKGTVKISDFGLSRSVNEYYSIQGGSALPLRWSAPEILSQSKCTSKSDVYSFGVVAWEIFKNGLTPFVSFSNDEVSEKIMAGQSASILTQPSDCPDDVYHLMRACWSMNPNERPEFPTILQELTKIEAILFPLTGTANELTQHEQDSFYANKPPAQDQQYANFPKDPLEDDYANEDNTRYNNVILE